MFADDGSPSGYIPGEGLNVSVSQPIQWHLNVTNRMGVVQLVEVRYRIGNSTSVSPNSTTPAFSLPAIGVAERFVANLETAVIDFNWNIVNATSTGNGSVCLTVDTGSGPVFSPVCAASGKDFRFIFEMWTLNTTSGSFEYGWVNQGTREGSWLQIWFNVATSG